MSSARRLSLLLALPLCTIGLLAQSDRRVIVVSLDGLPAYSLEDPNLPMPTLRRLIKEGASARRMTTVNPTVTWPNHTTMSTGVLPGAHGLYANGTIVRGDAPLARVEPWLDKTGMVHAPTIYDAAFQAGLTTAQVDWVAIQKAPTITWAYPEVPASDGVIEKEMIAAGTVTREEVDGFRKINIYRRDEIWTDAAIHILRKHRPNLLLYHLLSLDSTHHTYGPKTNAGLAAMAFLDGCLARVMQAVEATGPATVIVVSDHGFKPFRNQIQATAALRAAGIEEVDVIPEGGSALVYFKPGSAAALEPKVRTLFTALEGVAEVVGRGEMNKVQLPEPGTDPQTPEMVLMAKDGYSFAGAKSGPALTPIPETRGAHGYPASDPDMDAVFVVWGRGVRAGARLERIANLDVAPTIATLLGIKLPSAQGKAATDLLQ